MDSALSRRPESEREAALTRDLGPITRTLANRYFQGVRFPGETAQELRALHERGFVVHVMRTTSWLNFIYLTWALIRHGLPPVRAVVNLRPWFTKPWRRTAQRGDFEVRFTYARRQQGAGLIFLKRTALASPHGKDSREDPFPALIAMARRSDRPVLLVPELFAWERTNARLKPVLADYLFGSSEAPGFVHSVVTFWRNHERAQFRLGEPIDLQRFIQDNPADSDDRLARKVRGALNVHLARETRAVFGPPFKPADRIIQETLRDRTLHQVVLEEAAATHRNVDALEREAERNLNSIAARVNPTAIAVAAPVLNAVFSRIYEGVEVDEAGLERALRSASRAPLVLCSSHKSHVDYLVLPWVLWNRGYSVPLVAAGANLSFFPLGTFLRRCGAFFLRRSFKGDRLYTATFKAYVKKLVHDGAHTEFFPEGGRSRTGKLLQPKLGLLTWQVEAVLEGARNDLTFVPISIDYEKVVESGEYRHELAGGEKKAEDLKGLLKTPKVLARNYGRIHLGFDEPISLVDFMRSRGLSGGDLGEDQRKSLVRALGHRIMYGISRVSTVTPHALLSAGLLAHQRRGIRASELAERIRLLRGIAETEGSPLSRSLRDAPSDPLVMGPIQDALRTLSRDGMVRMDTVRDDVIFHAESERRTELSFYKNTLMNLVAPRALVASALLSTGGEATLSVLNRRALYLSRLFKVEFIYRVGANFDVIFAETLDRLTRAGLTRVAGEAVRVAPERHSRPELLFLANLLRDYLESYLLGAMALEDVARLGSMEKKGLVKSALELGRAEFLAGRVDTPESLSRPTLENAVSYFVDQKLLAEQDKRLTLTSAAQDPAVREALRAQIRSFLALKG